MTNAMVPLRSHLAVDQAEELIAALLPTDSRWHSARALLDAAEAHGLTARTMQRAAERLGLERRRTREFGARVDWRWANGRPCSDMSQREIDQAWREIERARAALPTGDTGDNFTPGRRAA